MAHIVAHETRQCESLCYLSMRFVTVSELLCDVPEQCEVSRLQCDVTGLLDD